jgi:hypothetical protein
VRKPFLVCRKRHPPWFTKFVFAKFFSLFDIISTQRSHIYQKQNTNSCFSKLRAISNLLSFFLYTLYIWSENPSPKSEANFVLTAQTKTIERDWKWRPIALQFPPSWQGVCRNFVFWLRFILFYLALPTRAGSPQQHMPITVGPFCLTHPVNFPCGRKPEYPEETHDFRQSVDFYSFHMGTGFESHWESSHWDLNLRPQRWKASALTTWPPKPLFKD